MAARGKHLRTCLVFKMSRGALACASDIDTVRDRGYEQWVGRWNVIVPTI